MAAHNNNRGDGNAPPFWHAEDPTPNQKQHKNTRTLEFA